MACYRKLHSFDCNDDCDNGESVEIRRSNINKRHCNKMEDIKQIDFVKIAKTIRKHLKTYAISLPTAFILSCLLIICVPRYYRCTVTLAPEMSNLSSSSLSQVASSFGFDISSASGVSGDAILPELYPDLVNSVNFRTSLFHIMVKTDDGCLKTTYYDYLLNHQKTPWWTTVINWCKNLFSKKEEEKQSNNKIDPFRLTKQQNSILMTLENKITCSVDKKNNVIAIIIEDQDPLICATMADSVKNKLQYFITDYRTSKARNDLAYTEKLYNDAKSRYVKSRQTYASFADANEGLILESYKSKLEDLENEMQLNFNTYTMMSNQLQAARAKVQERTPAFTTLQSASVPLKPAGPKRMIFVAVITLLTFIGTTIKILYKENI